MFGDWRDQAYHRGSTMRARHWEFTFQQVADQIAIELFAFNHADFDGTYKLASLEKNWRTFTRKRSVLVCAGCLALEDNPFVRCMLVYNKEPLSPIVNVERKSLVKQSNVVHQDVLINSECPGYENITLLSRMSFSAVSRGEKIYAYYTEALLLHHYKFDLAALEGEISDLHFEFDGIQRQYIELSHLKMTVETHVQGLNDELKNLFLDLDGYERASKHFDGEQLYDFMRAKDEIKKITAEIDSKTLDLNDQLSTLSRLNDDLESFDQIKLDLEFKRKEFMDRFKQFSKLKTSVEREKKKNRKVYTSMIKRFARDAPKTHSCKIFLKKVKDRTFRFRAPVSYQGKKNATIDIPYKEHLYSRSRIIKPMYHLIMLAGGPGPMGCYKDLISELLKKYKDKIIIHEIQYRGTVVSCNGKDLDFDDSFQCDLNDIGWDQCAHDVALLSAITHNKYSIQKSILFGFSAGAVLAQKSVQLHPDRFTAAIIGGMPYTPLSNTYPTHQGLCDLCSEDPLCGALFGPENVCQKITKMYNELDNESNPCKRKFFSLNSGNNHMNWKERRYLKEDIFYRFADENFYSENYEMTAIQVALELLKATNDCEHPGTYEQDVLKDFFAFKKEFRRLSKGINREFYSDSLFFESSKAKFESTMDIDDKISSLCAFDDQIVDKPHQEILDGVIQEFPAWIPDSFEHIETEKTNLYFFGGRLDFNTTLTVQKDLYESSIAPSKHWFMFNNRGHTFSESFVVSLFDHAVSEKTSKSEIHKAIKEFDADRKVSFNQSEYSKKMNKQMKF